MEMEGFLFVCLFVCLCWYLGIWYLSVVKNEFLSFDCIRQEMVVCLWHFASPLCTAGLHHSGDEAVSVCVICLFDCLDRVVRGGFTVRGAGGKKLRGAPELMCGKMEDQTVSASVCVWQILNFNIKALIDSFCSHLEENIWSSCRQKELQCCCFCFDQTHVHRNHMTASVQMVCVCVCVHLCVKATQDACSSSLIDLLTFSRHCFLSSSYTKSFGGRFIMGYFVWILCHAHVTVTNSHSGLWISLQNVFV